MNAADAILWSIARHRRKRWRGGTGKSMILEEQALNEAGDHRNTEIQFNLQVMLQEDYAHHSSSSKTRPGLQSNFITKQKLCSKEGGGLWKLHNKTEIMQQRRG